MKSTGDFRAIVHNGIWPIKYVVLAGLIGCMFLIPAESFFSYYIVTFFFSSIFIVIQAILLVDFAWVISSRWVDKMENEDNAGLHRFLLVGCTIAAYTFVIVFTIIYYVYYSGCSINVFFITFNLIIVIGMSILSVLPKIQENNPRSGIFQAAVLGLYITYLVGSAVASQPTTADFSCSAAGVGSTSNWLTKAMAVSGLIIAFFAIAYQAMSTGSSSKEFFGESSNDADEDESIETAYNYSWFHFVFFLAGMYSMSIHWVLN